MKTFFKKNLKTILFLSLIFLFFALCIFFGFPAIRQRIFIFGLWFMAEIYFWTILQQNFPLFKWSKSDSKSRKIGHFFAVLTYWSPMIYILTVLFLYSFFCPRIIFNPHISLFLGVSVVFYLLKFLASSIYLIVKGFIKILGIVFPNLKSLNFYQNFSKIGIRVLFIILPVALGFILYGVLFTAKNVQYRYFVIEDSKLPVEELKIVHISDLHLNYFKNKTDFLEKVIAMVNAENPDIIAITGDDVSFSTEEFVEHLTSLKKLQARQAIFSVLGNHDYGNYIRWTSESDKQKNLQRLKDLKKELGWIQLNNQNIIFELDSEKIIQVAGIEFWSKKPHFKNFGNLEETSKNLDSNLFILFLSHNPQLWEEALKQNTPFNLMLSGHTHGMQFGIATQNTHWSPAAWLYKQWGGLYRKNGKALSVNTGISTVGIPTRIGIPPEITVITVKGKRDGTMYNNK